MSHRFSKLGGDSSWQQGFSLSDFANSFAYLLGSSPFDQVTFGSGLQSAANVLFALISGHHDNPRFGGSVCHQLSDRLQPIFLWHPQVKQKNIGRKFPAELAGLLAIASLSYDFYIFLRFKNFHQPFSNDRVIVRNQNSNDIRRGFRKWFHDGPNVPGRPAIRF